MEMEAYMFKANWFLTKRGFKRKEPYKMGSTKAEWIKKDILVKRTVYFYTTYIIVYKDDIEINRFDVSDSKKVKEFKDFVVGL
jgi:hypothetical protein